MHGDHLAVVPAAKRIGTQDDDRLDGKLSQGCDPVAQDAIEADAVKVNRDPKGHFNRLSAAAETISSFFAAHWSECRPGEEGTICRRSMCFTPVERG